jgi:1-acyl-sn-glycerol-3-phosphate acyltransferase
VADPDETDFDTGATREFALSDLGTRLPASLRDDLRTHLPGLEPERHLTDWGRSERVEGIVDRTVYGFLYHYWFRVEVEGIGNVPADGGALLVANHAGAMPSDSAMVLKAVREEHPSRRSVHLATDLGFKSIPGVGMLATKLGAVQAHPANLHRLLFDERELVLSFPEGHLGAGKPLRERYRLRRFDPAFVATALRARVPIVPVAVMGAEESVPVVGRVNPLARFTRLPALPLTTGLPLPAKFRIRFLEPVAPEGYGEEPWRDRALVESLGHEIRALIQENLLELVAGRRSVWLG